jgi:hypothetical protein
MLTTDRVAGGALALLGAFMIHQSLQLPLGSWRHPGAGYTPLLLAALLLVFGVLVVAMGGATERIDRIGWGEARHAVFIVLVCAFMCFALERLGYRLTMTVALLFLVAAIERKHPLGALVFAVGLAFGSFYLFDTLLRVQLPRGPFGI